MILHKFREHQQNPDTEILILGTFHPDVENGADFYYGRPRNYLWQLLSNCFNQPSLKGQPLIQKQTFMQRYRIDFADIILTLDGIPADQEANYGDAFIDQHVAEWHSTPALIDSLPNIKAVYFTRKTFQGIPNIDQRISMIQNHCQHSDKRFGLLETPSRFANQAKLNAWQQVMGLN